MKLKLQNNYFFKFRVTKFWKNYGTHIYKRTMNFDTPYTNVK